MVILSTCLYTEHNFESIIFIKHHFERINLKIKQNLKVFYKDQVENIFLYKKLKNKTCYIL